MTPVTTAARRIAREHNQCGPALTGGVLVFRPDGTGGEWYSRDARLPSDLIRVPVTWYRMTPRGAQDLLDNVEEL